jgi:hypothetical protein
MNTGRAPGREAMIWAMPRGFSRRGLSTRGASQAIARPVPVPSRTATNVEVMMPFQIYARADGNFEVVDVRTGQIRFCGSNYGALSVQAQLNAEARRRPTSR